MGVDTRKSLPFNSSISYTMFFVVANLKILVPYNFDPEYLVEEINSHQHLINETTVQPQPPFRTTPIIFQKKKST